LIKKNLATVASNSVWTIANETISTVNNETGEACETCALLNFVSVNSAVRKPRKRHV